MNGLTEAQMAARVIRIHETLQEVAPSIPVDELETAAITLAQMDLDEFNALWARRRADFPDHLPLVEGRIISLILDRALAEEDIQIAVDWEYLGSSDDDPEEGLAFTRDRSDIERQIAATSITLLRFFRQNVRDEDIPQGRIGWVMLVHGNIEDVVSDYSDNEWTRALMEPVNELAGKIAAGSLG